jgi:hypothetical protein
MFAACCTQYDKVRSLTQRARRRVGASCEVLSARVGTPFLKRELLVYLCDLSGNQRVPVPLCEVPNWSSNTQVSVKGQVTQTAFTLLSVSYPY